MSLMSPSPRLPKREARKVEPERNLDLDVVVVVVVLLGENLTRLVRRQWPRRVDAS